MTIDISKIKPGDKVTLVPLEVVDTETAFGVPGILIRGSPDSSNFSAWIGEEDITAHHPAPREFQVGDRVRMAGRLATVHGVDGVEAWLRFDGDNGNLTRRISQLTLLEAGQ